MSKQNEQGKRTWKRMNLPFCMVDVPNNRAMSLRRRGEDFADDDVDVIDGHK